MSQDGETPHTPGIKLAQGATLGRYVIVSPVGAGGMGVVYAAYDPELDRKIALKVLRSEGWAGADESEGRARLVREAQSLARLAHPNVITVHDVGTFGGQVFIAMEFVDGATLTRWLAEQRRGWREVLPVFLAAGRGLAAAHDAGLVHRDFKPDNVLIGNDGRVRVTDFGLARPVGERGERELPRVISPAFAAAAAAESLTQDGDVLGTPAYMAPEQLAGQSADARSDQWSYCAALYEALYGKLPDAAQAGEPFEPGKSPLPAWLRRTLLRGLSFDPEKRFPSMTALLTALDSDPSAKRRRWLSAAAFAAVIAAALFALVHAGRNGGQKCRGADQRLDGIWDTARKEAVKTAFLATGVPYAAAAWAKVEPALDEEAASWVAMRTAACEASERGEQSGELLDLRMQCLDDRLVEIGGLTDLFAKADAKVVEKAVPAALAVTDLARCADSTALSARVRPPADPQARLHLLGVRQKMAVVAALTAAGKYKEALPPAQDAADDARSLGYQPLVAEALYRLAEVQDRLQDAVAAEKTLRESARAALAGQDDFDLVRAWAVLTWVLGQNHARYQDAMELGASAQSALERLRGEDRDRAGLELHNALGVAQVSEGKYREAVGEDEQALALARKLPGDRMLEADVLDNLSIAHFRLGDNDQALDLEERSLAIKESLLGPDHPDIASGLNNEGMILYGLDRYADGVAVYRRCIAIRDKTIGHDTPLTASAFNNLGNLLSANDQLADALAAYKEGLAIKERKLAPDHPAIADSLINIAEILVKLGKLDEARADFQRALAIIEKARGPSHPSVVNALGGLGDLEIQAGHAGRAIPFLERALTVRLANQGNPAELGKIRFSLARALWESKATRARALQLATQARADFKDGHLTDPELEPWLASHHL